MVQMCLLVFRLQVRLTKEMVESMNKDPIIFAMANPDPEIMPDDSKSSWCKSCRHRAL